MAGSRSTGGSPADQDPGRRRVPGRRHPRPDGSYLVTEHNCAILGVAQRYGLACSTEIEFLREALPDAAVERVPT